MNRQEMRMLSLFADNYPHPEGEIHMLAMSTLKCTYKCSKDLLRKMHEYDLVRPIRQFTTNEHKEYKLTAVGDEAYRWKAIDLGGKFRYFKYAERNPDSIAKYAAD